MKKNSIKLSEIIFSISYTLFLFYYIVCCNSNFNKLMSKELLDIIRYSAYAGFLVKSLFNNMKIKDWLIQFLLIVLSMIVYFKSKDAKIFEITLIVFAAKNIDFKKIAKLSLYEIALFCILVVSSSLLGVIDNYTFIRKESTSLRYALGFTYVAQLPSFIMEMVFLAIYLNDQKDSNKLNYIMIIILLAFSYIGYRLTDVRNTFVCSVLLILLYVIVKKRPTLLNNKIVSNTIRYSFIFCLSISLFFLLFYNNSNETYRNINTLFSNRLEIVDGIKSTYDIRLFGNNIKMYGLSAVLYQGVSYSDYSYIDNAYIQLLYKNGIIISIIITIAYTLLSSKALKNRKYHVIALWLFITSISSLVGDSYLSIYYNCGVISFLQIIRGKNEEEN